MSTSYTDKNLQNFLLELLAGKAGLSPLRSKMTFQTSDKWDGTEAPIIEEEEQSLKDDLWDELGELLLNIWIKLNN